MTIDDFLEGLESVRRSGGGYMARCPAHDDGEASLSVTEGEEGILVKCHAGCETQEVVRSMGLAMKDLFPEKRTNHAEPEAIYEYTDAMGNPLYQALRFPGKKFKQRHQDADGNWVWNLKGIPRVLYRLVEVNAAVAAGKPIFICEGEKDVEALVAAGWEATCNPMGAGKWDDSFSDHLLGAEVVIVQDRDEPGRNHAKRVKDSLIGKARSIAIVQAKTGKDAADHLAAGWKVEDFVEARQRPTKGLYSAIDLYEEAMERLDMREEDLPVYDPLGDLSRNLSFRPGRIYVCGGYTGDGKTALALQATRGLCEKHNASVLYVSLEMTNLDLNNRLLEHKGLPMKVLDQPWLIRGSMYESMYKDAMEEIRSWDLSIMFQPGAGADMIVKQAWDTEADFVIIDHVHRFAWGNERRRLEEELMKLTNLALEFNIPVLILAQLRRFSRGPGIQTYPRPILQDFRETEAFGNEAARAMAVWRTRDLEGHSYDPSGSSEIIILKDRFGPLSSPIVWFDGERQLFLPRPVGQEEVVQEERPTVELQYADVWGEE